MNIFKLKLIIVCFFFVSMSSYVIAQQSGGAPAGGGALGNPTNTQDTSGNNFSTTQGPQNYSGPGIPQEYKDAMEAALSGKTNGETSGGDSGSDSGNTETAEGSGENAGVASGESSREGAGENSGAAGGESGDQGGNQSGNENKEPSGEQNVAATEEQNKKQAAEQAEKERQEQIRKEEEQTKAAENAAAEAMKQYVEESAKLSELEKKLDNTEKKIREDLSKKDKDTLYYYADIEQLKNDAKAKTEIEVRVENQKRKVEESKKTLEEKNAEMKDAYGNLADIYNEAGDPVQISTGQFMAEYDDFFAIDYISNFKITRKLNHEGFTESFGTDWICPLDSRIAVCQFFDYSQYVYTITELLTEIQKDKTILTDVYKDYPNYRNPRINNFLNQLNEKSDIYEYLLDYYTHYSNQNYTAENANSTVRYGALSDFSSVIGTEEMLIFIDEEGRKRIFYFTQKGYWESLDSFSREKIKIYSKNQYGKKSNERLYKWGYIVQYENGITCEFSNTGTKSKIIDRNGNELQFGYNNISNRVSSILLPTSELINIYRNQNNLITRIEGNYSGKTAYTYSGNRLTSVTDNKGVKLYYAYDSEGDLTRIGKADNSSVQISYGFDAKRRKVCTSVTNENGNKEAFQYEPAGNKVIHTTLAGGKEEYFYNNKGGTVCKKTVSGIPVEIACDTKGRVNTVKQLGNIKTYVYDNNNRVSSIINSKGGTDSYAYNQFGDLKAHTDGDGYVRVFNYDNRGNVISIYFQGNLVQSFTYNSKGLLIEMSEAEINYYYSYNNYGQLIQKIKKDKNRVLMKEEWKYDDKGQIIEYFNSQTGKVTLTYKSNSILENYDGKKTIERFFDARKRYWKIIYTDLITNTQYKKSYILDQVGNITKVFVGNGIYAEYEYTPDNKIKTEIIWNNPGNKSEYKTATQRIKTEFSFGPENFIVSKTKSLAQEVYDKTKVNIIEATPENKLYYRYRWKSDGLTIESCYGDKQFFESLDYDCFGRLIKIAMSDGFTKEFTYSKAGRLLNVKDSNGRNWDFGYKSDGSYIVTKKNKDQGRIICEYDADRKLKNFIDYDGEITAYSYDWDNNLLSVSNRFKTVKYVYDSKSRIIRKETFNANNQKIDSVCWFYNENNNSVTETTGDNTSVQHFYDQLNREIKTIDPCGTTMIEYNLFGQIKRKSFPDGMTVNYEYTPTGKISCSYKNNGEELFQKYDLQDNCIQQILNGKVIFTGSYGNNEKLKQSVNEFGAVTNFEFDYGGVLRTQNNYDTGTFTYHTGNDEISVIDSTGYEYKKTVGNNGKIKSFQDKYGNTSFYRYDFFGRLVHEKAFNDVEKFVDYDKKNNTISVSYTSGENIIYRKNDNNQISAVKNEYYDLEYHYNEMGFLIREINKKPSFEVNYSYDNLGRCISKKSDRFEFLYSYDLSGNVTEIKENLSGCKLSLFYDNRNREIKRTYSNGNVVETGYTDNQKSYVVVKDKNGQIIHGDFILFDSSNRIYLQCNEKGELRRFHYDSTGRLSAVEYSFSEDVMQFAYKEAVLCGMFIKEEKPELPYSYLSDEEFNSLVNLINKSTANSKVKIQKEQQFWKEEYNYSATGNVISVKNPYGVVRYDYDYLNRVTRKYCTGQKSSETNYKWDKAGNLVEISSRDKLVKLSYNGMNQLSTLIEEYYESKDYNFIEYLYDGLGRRSGEIINGNQQFEYIYDGLSRSLLCRIPVTVNHINAEKYSSYIIAKNEVYEETLKSGLQDENYNSNPESDYRTMDLYSMEPYSPYKQNTLRADDKESSDKTTVVKNRTNQFAVFMNAFGCECVELKRTSDSYNNGYDINFFVQDYFGNVQKVCDANNVISYTDYDVWGNPFYSGSYNNFSGKEDISLCNLVLYDFGSRLYLPEIKSFTSMDRKKMDGNWYAYCPADPVNYKDNDGFYKKSTSKKQNAEYTEKLTEFMLFDGDSQSSEGSEMGIPLSFDCADTTAAIDNQCAEISGMSDYSPMADDFDQNYSSGNYQKAKKDTSSSDYWNGDGSKTTKTSSVISDLQNPEIVTPGTIIVTAPDSENGVYTGHTIMVIARDYDENGKIKGIVYIEGHMGDSKPAETGYMYVDDECNGYLNTYNIKSWKGQYSGTYELEASDAASWYDEPKVKCGK